MGAKFSFSGANTSAYCLSNASTIAFSTSAIAYYRNPKNKLNRIRFFQLWERIQNKDLGEEKEQQRSHQQKCWWLKLFIWIGRPKGRRKGGLDCSFQEDLTC